MPSPDPWLIRYGDLAVRLIPILENNVAYLLIHGTDAVVVDPGEAAPMLAYARAHGLRITEIWITHGHHDHIGGFATLRAETRALVTAPTGLPLHHLDRAVGEGDTVHFGPARFRVWQTPGHHAFHVAYVQEARQPDLAFIGDILFGAGCGRLFGFPPHQLFETLQRLNTLPEAMHLYCGHDLAEQNLEFALSLEPKNLAMTQRLLAVRQQAARGAPELPLTLSQERRTNPFLRTAVPSLRAALAMPEASDLDVFTELRHRKDVF